VVAATGAPSAEIASNTSSGDVASVQRPVTRLQQGISKTKTYIDGIVRWCMHASTSADELATLTDALGNQKWHDTMDSEYQALLHNRMWHLVPRPKGKNIIRCKWVYKVKRKADGTIDQYKAHLIAKGFK
jgi:hypothetical protein